MHIGRKRIFSKGLIALYQAFYFSISRTLWLFGSPKSSETSFTRSCLFVLGRTLDKNTHFHALCRISYIPGSCLEPASTTRQSSARPASISRCHPLPILYPIDFGPPESIHRHSSFKWRKYWHRTWSLEYRSDSISGILVLEKPGFVLVSERTTEMINGFNFRTFISCKTRLFGDFHLAVSVPHRYRSQMHAIELPQNCCQLH
jgi:hypothetical protein